MLRRLRIFNSYIKITDKNRKNNIKEGIIVKIITISREFGSGGRELGKRLAETLDIPCFAMI